MENAIRWIFFLVTAVVLLYACALCKTTCEKMDAAGEVLSALTQTEQTIKEENKKLSELLAAADVSCG